MSDSIPPQCGPFYESVPFPNFFPPFVVYALPLVSRGTTGRACVREALLRILQNWAGGPVQIHETQRGPEVAEHIRGQKIFLSLSYAGNTAWMALAANAPIGLDAVSLSECADWEDVASLYFEETTIPSLKNAPSPTRAFALAWAKLEARCKHAGLPLSEKNPPPEVKTFTQWIGDTALAVAFI